MGVVRGPEVSLLIELSLGLAPVGAPLQSSSAASNTASAGTLMERLMSGY